jgi:hypothetical protein
MSRALGGGAPVGCTRGARTARAQTAASASIGCRGVDHRQGRYGLPRVREGGAVLAPASAGRHSRGRQVATTLITRAPRRAVNAACAAALAAGDPTLKTVKCLLLTGGLISPERPTGTTAPARCSADPAAITTNHETGTTRSSSLIRPGPRPPLSRQSRRRPPRKS